MVELTTILICGARRRRVEDDRRYSGFTVGRVQTRSFILGRIHKRPDVRRPCIIKSLHAGTPHSAEDVKARYKILK
ncbi:hypothetical protein TNCV_53301 [Trichonephila clavipes]|nr:hypothetical protein TNCV_53301 [Trichonephila clavipes]